MLFRCFLSVVDRDGDDVPDVAAVFPDRAVGREAAHPRAVEDRHAGPAFVISIRSANPFLTIDIALIVSEKHVIVTNKQRIHQWPEQVAVAIREKSRTNHIDSFAQRGVAFIHPARVISARLLLHHLFCRQAEKEKLLMANGIADLDVRSIERADGKCPVHRKFHIAGTRKLLSLPPKSVRRDRQQDKCAARF